MAAFTSSENILVLSTAVAGAVSGLIFEQQQEASTPTFHL
jgi:hypothetical protein